MEFPMSPEDILPDKNRKQALSVLSSVNTALVCLAGFDYCSRIDEAC